MTNQQRPVSGEEKRVSEATTLEMAKILTDCYVRLNALHPVTWSAPPWPSTSPGGAPPRAVRDSCCTPRR